MAKQLLLGLRLLLLTALLLSHPLGIDRYHVQGRGSRHSVSCDAVGEARRGREREVCV